MRRIVVLFVSWLLLSMLAAGQAQTRLAIRAGKLIDGKSEKPLENVLILRWKETKSYPSPRAGARLRVCRSSI